jgi:N-formylglutamate deformylase
VKGFHLVQRAGPLLISLPHAGFELPEELVAERPTPLEVDAPARYLPRALSSEDTDWHLEAVYAPLAERLNASLLVPRWSRYVIDLNRPAQDTPMYPGVNNTGLCPSTFFDGTPLYRDGRSPDEAERARRLAAYWQPYHQALSQELTRLHGLHGVALLWDGHSIESKLPWLFDGTLPTLNLGSNAGTTCAPERLQAVAKVLGSQRDYTHVVDGRFKGGFITRHYGQPARGWHALQMEMVQASYMLEDPSHPTPRPLLTDRTERLQGLLLRCLQAFVGGAA